MTGASSGIGRAIAEAYAAEGAVVLLTHRDSPVRAREVADAIATDGGRALVRQADLATRAACGIACEQPGTDRTWRSGIQD